MTTGEDESSLGEPAVAVPVDLDDDVRLRDPGNESVGVDISRRRGQLDVGFIERSRGDLLLRPLAVAILAPGQLDLPEHGRAAHGYVRDGVSTPGWCRADRRRWLC